MTDVDVSVAEERLRTIQRMVNEVPFGSTIRSAPPRPRQADDARPTGVAYRAPTIGTYPCKSKCGAVVTQPGVCVDCAAASAQKDALAMFGRTLTSIPKTFRWAHPASPDLSRRAMPIGANGMPLDPMALSRQMASVLLSGERLAYVLWGPTKGGKTSVACAVARDIVDTAVKELLLNPQVPPADRFAPLPALPAIVKIASGVRFVRTIDLSPPRDRGEDVEPPAFGLALRASILVLDDGSKESSGAEGSWSDAARALATVEVIAKRWDRGRPTIFTTFLDAAGVGNRYDGGTRRRLFDDSRARAIEFRGLEGATK